MNDIFICGVGAVSPAGWGVQPLMETLARGKPLPAKNLARAGRTRPAQVRSVPAASPRPARLNHARLRRTSPIAQHAFAAALEALGEREPGTQEGSRLGIVVCVMSGCVNYSRRFYDEVLKDPAIASPLVFPETVFNAPASHIGALLGTTLINYTLVGDPGTFLQGLALGANWLSTDRVDGCLVVGAEEVDWLTAEAFQLFDRRIVASDGAGAVYLRRESNREPAIRLEGVTQPRLFSNARTRAEAAREVRSELNHPLADELLCDGLQGVARMDRDEAAAWQDWKGARLSPKRVLGEASTAAAAWQCVAASELLRRGAHSAATVSVVGSNQQAIAARFVKGSA